MTNKELEDLQAQFFFQQGIKVDIYHSEEHRGILIVKAGAALHPINVIQALTY